MVEIDRSCVRVKTVDEPRIVTASRGPSEVRLEDLAHLGESLWPTLPIGAASRSTAVARMCWHCAAETVSSPLPGSGLVTSERAQLRERRWWCLLVIARANDREPDRSRVIFESRTAPALKSDHSRVERWNEAATTGVT